MSEPAATARPHATLLGRLAATLRALVRTRVTAGLLVVVPIYAAYWVVKFIFGLMRDSSLWVVEWFLESRAVERFIVSLGFDWRALENGRIDVLPLSWQWGIWAFSVFLTIFILYAIGLFTANIVGRRVVELVELAVDRVPLVKTVYRACKQILLTFAGQEQRPKFQRVVMFPFMAPNVYSLGFVTNTIREPRSGEEYVVLFRPNTPNPTSGYVLFVRRAEIVELDWTVEDAIKAVMSGGILLPYDAGARTPLPVPAAV